MRRSFGEIEKTIHVVIERRNAMDGKGAKPAVKFSNADTGARVLIVEYLEII